MSHKFHTEVVRLKAFTLKGDPGFVELEVQVPQGGKRALADYLETQSGKTKCSVKSVQFTWDITDCCYVAFVLYENV